MNEKNEKARIPKQQRSIQTKKQILEAAMQLFSEKGYHNTNSKEIAKQAGVATGCFYSYFTDKKAVFLEALTVYFEQFNTIIQKHMALLTQNCKNNREIIEGLIKNILDAHDIFTGFHNELIVMFYSDSEIRKIIDTQHEKNIEFVAFYLREWQDELKVVNTEAASTIIYWTMHSVIDTILFSDTGKKRKDELIEELIDMFIVYIFKKNN